MAGRRGGGIEADRDRPPQPSRSGLTRRRLLAGLAAIPAAGGVACLCSAAADAAEHAPALGGRLPGKENALVSVHTGRRVVALSLDDGPHPAYTPHVLELLAAHRAHATFFMIGAAVDGHRDLARAVAAGGHELANHTYTHAHLDALRATAVMSELRRGSSALGRLGVPLSDLFRPPLGLSSETVRRQVTAEGLRMVLWNGCVERFVHRAPVAPGVDELLAGVRPGHILLAHDGGGPDRSLTLAALPLLFDGLARRGFEVVTVGQLVAGAHPAHHQRVPGPR